MMLVCLTVRVLAAVCPSCMANISLLDTACKLVVLYSFVLTIGAVDFAEAYKVSRKQNLLGSYRGFPARMVYLKHGV